MALRRYYKSLDHLAIVMAGIKKGRLDVAEKHLMLASEEDDLEDALDEIDDSQDENVEEEGCGDGEYAAPKSKPIKYSDVTKLAKALKDPSLRAKAEQFYPEVDFSNSQSIIESLDEDGNPKLVERRALSILNSLNEEVSSEDDYDEDEWEESTTKPMGGGKGKRVGRGSKIVRPNKSKHTSSEDDDYDPDHEEELERIRESRVRKRLKNKEEESTLDGIEDFDNEDEWEESTTKPMDGSKGHRPFDKEDDPDDYGYDRSKKPKPPRAASRGRRKPRKEESSEYELNQDEWANEDEDDSLDETASYGGNLGGIVARVAANLRSL